LAWACRNKYQYIDGAESFLFFDVPTDGFMLNQTVFVEGRPATQPAAWNGECRPPVGVSCEAKSMARGVERDWFNATVLYSSPYTVVLDDYQAGEFVAHPATMHFRPIRTPEQIAADERSKYCDRIFGVLTSATRAENRSDMAEALYDAGLRFKDGAK
jgi:hypothetical protein